MDSLEYAKERVCEILARSQGPAVLWSAGKDSMLLLWLVRQVRPDTPVIWFRTGQDERFARQVVRNWDLTVFSWPPADVYTLQQDSQRTLVHEYAIGSDRLPVLIDLAGSNGPCAADKFPHRTPAMFLPFDTLLVGWKDSDTHWVKGDAPLAEDGFKLGRSEIVAPIRHMTDTAVRSAIIDHRIPFEPTPDELVLCTDCISTKPLEEFRSQYNLKEVGNNGG